VCVRESVCVTERVFVCDRERECVCVTERELCVFDRERSGPVPGTRTPAPLASREPVRERERGRERERERASERVCDSEGGTQKESAAYRRLGPAEAVLARRPPPSERERERERERETECSAEMCSDKFSIEELLHRNVKRFRGGLVFKAHRLSYHSTLGLGNKEEEKVPEARSSRGRTCATAAPRHPGTPKCCPAAAAFPAAERLVFYKDMLPYALC